MIDIGLRLIKELRQHDKLTEKDLALGMMCDNARIGL